MANYTTTFTADFCLSEDVQEDHIDKLSAENARKLAEIVLKGITGADTVNVRNVKLFIHDGNKNKEDENDD